MDKVTVIESAPEIKVVHCVTEEDKNAGYLLRHSVFVSELNYEKQRTVPLEKDRYDNEAEHYLVKDAKTDQNIGYFRAISGTSHYVKDAEFMDDTDRPENTDIQVEISRLLLLQDYRAKGVIIDVMSGINDLMTERGTDIYAVVERSLGAVILRAGYGGKRLSKPFDLNGERCVFMFKRTYFADTNVA